MTDFTALVASDEWKPLVEAVEMKLWQIKRVRAGRSINEGIWPEDEIFREQSRFEAPRVIAAFLTAAVERGAIKKVYFGMQPALVFAIIQTGEKHD